MVFKCQEDSFLKEFTSKVVKCEPTKAPIVEYGKVIPFEGYQVTLENTIIFPAGGGQPHDMGWLNDTQVHQVLRQGSEAVHFVSEPIEVGTEVVQKIDWDRRFDHMQQHSGQHLLSAILEKEHSAPTTSWWLGAEECYIELDATAASKPFEDVEGRCNELIREALPVAVKFCRIDDPELDEAHTRGLPKDCMETIRIISIGDVDQNMCCGTHVSNLSQLQMIKILGMEGGKKGKINLRFIVGNRIVKIFQTMLYRERDLTVLLKNEPSKHQELVEKLQRNQKVTNKNLQNVLLELAQSEIEKIKNTNPLPDYVFCFKKEATPEYNRVIIKGLEGMGMFVFVAWQDPEKPNEGQIMMLSSMKCFEELGSVLASLLECKGLYKDGKFQGKAQSMSAIKKCRKKVEEYFNQ